MVNFLEEGFWPASTGVCSSTHIEGRLRLANNSLESQNALFGLCVPMSYRALSRSQLLRQRATKQFHVNRMIIYDQTGAEYLFTLNSYVQPHSG